MELRRPFPQAIPKGRGRGGGGVGGETPEGGSRNQSENGIPKESKMASQRDPKRDINSQKCCQTSLPEHGPKKAPKIYATYREEMMVVENSDVAKT